MRLWRGNRSMRDDVEFTIQAFVTNRWFKIDWFDKEIPHVKLLDIVRLSYDYSSYSYFSLFIFQDYIDLWLVYLYFCRVHLYPCFVCPHPWFIYFLGLYIVCLYTGIVYTYSSLLFIFNFSFISIVYLRWSHYRSVYLPSYLVSCWCIHWFNYYITI